MNPQETGPLRLKYEEAISKYEEIKRYNLWLQLQFGENLHKVFYMFVMRFFSSHIFSYSKNFIIDYTKCCLLYHFSAMINHAKKICPISYF